jgi:hypothetical protein
MEGFLPGEPFYDAYDPITRTRIIYFGETAEELERQEDDAFVYKNKVGYIMGKPVITKPLN